MTARNSSLPRKREPSVVPAPALKTPISAAKLAVERTGMMNRWQENASWFGKLQCSSIVSPPSRDPVH